MHADNIINAINDPKRKERLRERYEEQNFLKLNKINTGYMLSGNDLLGGFLGLQSHTKGFEISDRLKGLQNAYDKNPDFKEVIKEIFKGYPNTSKSLTFITVIKIPKEIKSELCQDLKDLECRGFLSTHNQLNATTKKRESLDWFIGVPEINEFKQDKTIMLAYFLEKGIISEKDIEAINENPVNPLIGRVREKVKNLFGDKSKGLER